MFLYGFFEMAAVHHGLLRIFASVNSSEWGFSRSIWQSRESLSFSFLDFALGISQSEFLFRKTFSVTRN